MQDVSKSFLELCQASLLLHEGKRKKVYMDTEMHPTIGIGFNLDRADADDLIESLGLDYKAVREGLVELTDAQIFALLKSDLLRAIGDATLCVTAYESLSEVRKLVLVDMMYNLGRTRFRGFKKMIAAVNTRRYSAASEEMLDSLWAQQVKTRATRLSKMMKTGILSPDIKKLVPAPAPARKKTAKTPAKSPVKAAKKAKKKA